MMHHSSDDSPQRSKRWQALLLPGLLFLGALLLRVWTLNWGLPFVEHVDEPALLEVAIRMAREGDPNPQRFLYPSLFYYLLVAVIQVHAWWGISQGLYSSIQDIPIKNNIFTIVPDLFVWARALTALLGAAAIPALFVLGKRMFDWRVGLLAALSLLFAPFHLTHSYFITTDVPTGIWVVLTLLGAWSITTTGSWRSYALAGVAAGLAAGTKYNAGVVVLAIMLAHGFYWGWAGLRLPLLRLIVAGVCSLLAFLATTPYALLDWPSFLAALRFNSEHYASGSHGDFIGRWQVAEYLAFFWRQGLYAPACLLLLLGLPLLVQRFPRQLALLLVVVVAEMLLLLSYAVNFVRNILPILPLLILLATAGAVTLADRLPRPRLRDGVLLGLALALLSPQIYWTIWQLRYWSQPYSMVAAARDVRELPQGLRIAAELPAPLFGGNPMVFPVARITDYSLEWYRANGFRYLVVSDDMRTADDRAAYERLQSAAQPVVTYPRRRLGIQPGPGGAILDLGVHPEALPFARQELHFGDQLVLLGYELQPGELRSRISSLEGAATREISAGQPLQLNLYWQTRAAMDRDYMLFIHVLDQRGERVAQRDALLRSDEYPTSHWQPGELVVERADFPLPALPPGEYRLVMGVYDAATGTRLPLADNPEGAATLTTLTVR